MGESILLGVAPMVILTLIQALVEIRTLRWEARQWKTLSDRATEGWRQAVVTLTQAQGSKYD